MSSIDWMRSLLLFHLYASESYGLVQNDPLFVRKKNNLINLLAIIFVLDIGLLISSKKLNND